VPLTGLTVNVLLKILLMGSLAQVGLALATAVGAWINLLLVLGFAVRAGYLELHKVFLQSLAFSCPMSCWGRHCGLPRDSPRCIWRN
jgi:peptidoglycan biosynthesis protein MviN/MurJ (putative lipid II flippase)